ncbi:hypothetical protein M8818_003862 [Zalaria obscura]|uniref:Uncharacterized protein n=1 Tax=Zalaria obscura TaxID=2024903 RepID=A0ACC3SFL7_9PEZI
MSVVRVVTRSWPRFTSRTRLGSLEHVISILLAIQQLPCAAHFSEHSHNPTEPYSLMHAPDMAASQSRTGTTFLDLPPEVRNRISKSVLVQDHIISPQVRRDGTKRLQIPALCQINKQLRAETLPIFYGANRFFVFKYGGSPVAALLRLIGEENVPMLRRLCFKISGRIIASEPDSDRPGAWVVSITSRKGRIYDKNEIPKKRYTHLCNTAEQIEHYLNGVLQARVSEGLTTQELMGLRRIIRTRE